MSLNDGLGDALTRTTTAGGTPTFFAWGRDFESANTFHRFNKEEDARIAKFESDTYLPQISQVFRGWTAQKDDKGNDNSTKVSSHVMWLGMGITGIAMGLISFVVRQTIELITEHKYKLVEPYLSEENGCPCYFSAWATVLSYSLFFVLVSVCVVVLIEPAAASSGIPEVIAYLNGVHIPRIFNIKTLVVKLVSVICCVGSGLPVGPEGPMIHMGGIVGAGITQGESSTFGFKIKAFENFRSTRTRRDFITAGVAAGVAAAFGAPVGGLLFAMEEVASFWNQRLGWMIFFGCMMSVFTANLLNSTFDGWSLTETALGSFASSTVLYEVTYAVKPHVFALIPAILCGICGGLFGSMFTVLNIKLTRWRTTHVAKSKARRIAEPLIICVLYASTALFLPATFECKVVQGCYPEWALRLNASGFRWTTLAMVDRLENTEEQKFMWMCEPGGAKLHYHAEAPLLAKEAESPAASPATVKKLELRNNETEANTTHFGLDQVTLNSRAHTTIRSDVHRYTCPPEKFDEVTGAHTIYYNDMSTLLFQSGESAIKALTNRGTAGTLGNSALWLMFLVYFVGACVSAGTACSAGLVVPMLLTGACYGRIIGEGVVLAYTMMGMEPLVYGHNGEWEWVDPGVFALIGASSFFGGVSRLTLSLTVIMIEISNDVHMLIMIMVSIMSAKWIADNLTHSFYHALLEVKCIPFLGEEISSGKNLAKFTIASVMAHVGLPVDIQQKQQGGSSGETKGCDEKVVEKWRRRRIKRITSLHVHPTLAQVQEVLNTTHGGFPVVDEHGRFIGLILRNTLELLIEHKEIAYKTEPGALSVQGTGTLEYAVVRESEGHHSSIKKTVGVAETSNYEMTDQVTQKQIDLEAYMDTSTMTVPTTMSLERTYLIFRSMALRHLPVVNKGNIPVGMITRKDIQGHAVDQALFGAHEH